MTPPPTRERRRRATFSHVARPDGPLYNSSAGEARELRELGNSKGVKRGFFGIGTVTGTQILSIVIVVLALVLPFFLKLYESKGYRSGVGSYVQGVSPWSPFPDHWVCPTEERVEKKGKSTFRNKVKGKMGLEEAAQKVVEEMEFSGGDIRKAVKAFLEEMDEGLQKDGTHMSQIPTYVTAVPNGTEKVSTLAKVIG